MSDRKYRQTRKRSARKPTSIVSRSPRTNEMIVRTSWTATSVTSGTTGTMSSWTSPTIYASSEYSVYQSLFTEVRLIKADFIFTPTQAANGTVNHGALVIGTNMLENQNTAATPTGYVDVQNLTHPVRFSSCDVKIKTYRMPVPKNLEFAAITLDAPNPPTPWAGSPGAVKWYGAFGTASTVYFNVHLDVIYHLRGRQ